MISNCHSNINNNQEDDTIINQSSASLPVKFILPNQPASNSPKLAELKNEGDNDDNNDEKIKIKKNKPTRPSLLNTKSFTHSVNSFYQFTEDRWKQHDPNHQHQTNNESRTSTGKALLMFLKAFIGSGVLFLPKGFEHGGLLLSIFLMILIASICLFAFLKLVKTQQVIGGTYGDVANKLYGTYMCYLVLFFIALSQLGFVCSYFIFISGNLVNIVQVLSHCKVMIPQKEYIWLPLIIVLPLVMIRHIARLSFTIIIADVFIFFGLICVLYFTSVQLIQHGVGPNIQLINTSQFGLMISTSIFSFEGIGLIIPISESMERPEKFPLVVYTGTIIVCVIYVLIGSMSYLAYGDQIKAAVIYNFPSSHGLTITSQLLYSIAVILT
ncbi:unnamed protein product [Cunninghamella echinulata]